MNQVVRDTLRESAEDVAVPHLDEVALARRVRSLHDSRRGRLAASLVAAVALPALAVPLALDALGDGDGGGRDAQVTGVPEGSTLGTVAFALEGTLHLQPADQYAGGSRDTGIEVEDVIAVRPDGVLVVDRESHVLLVPFDGGAPTRPLGAGASQRALSAADGTLGWQGLDNRVRVRLPDGTERVSGALDGPDQSLYDLEAGRWLVGEGTSLSLSDGVDGTLFVAPDQVTDAQVADGTVTVTTDGGTLFIDTGTREARTGPVAGRTGALSTDGRWFVANPNPEETAAGMVRGLWVWDTTTGKARQFTDFDDTGHVVDVAWQGDRALVVVETNADGQFLHTLYSCSVEDLTCTYHYEDESGTLRLPRS